MNGLIIDNAVLARVQDVLAYAEAHVYTMDDLLDQLNKERCAPGDADEFTMFIPLNFRVVFSYEEQLIGKCRHISISVPEKGRLPKVLDGIMIAGLFGFTDIMDADKVWEEDILSEGKPTGYKAINILERVDKNG